MDIRWLTVVLDLAPGEGSAAEPFWSRVTGTRVPASRGPDDAPATLLPSHGDAYLGVRRLRSGTGGCHLALHVGPGTGALDGAVARAVALGARERSGDEGGVIGLDSPGGFPFRLVGWNGEATVPAPENGAGLSRLDQLSLDAPPRLFEAECAFWAALTGWEPRSGSLAQFRSLVRPATVPVRLLFQRLDDDGARVTGHLDFSCDDRERLAALHTAAGARVVATFPHWTTMADPTGRPYCLTDRDPRTGLTRP